MRNKIIIGSIVLAVLAFIFWKPLYAGWLKFSTGAQAVQDAATMNGYTTYNQALYQPPFWQPLLSFFKANGAYVPTASNAQNGSNPAQYSVQG